MASRGKRKPSPSSARSGCAAKASDTYASGQGFINVISDAIQNENLDVTTVFECRAEHLVKDDARKWSA